MLEQDNLKSQAELKTEEIPLGKSVERFDELTISDDKHNNKVQESNKVDVNFLTSKSIITVIILFGVNLLNYIDRLTIASVLIDLQKYFKINDIEAGLLQTVFIVFFMIFAPFCGFLGDRYNRKMIMIVGLIIWISAVLVSSFVSPNHFIFFILLRGVVGIGEASYSTIAPTIIADIFVSDARSSMLMFFYFAIPIGSGLGFILGSKIGTYFDDWKWGVRFTPPFGLVLIIALLLFLDDPKRGVSDYGKNNYNLQKKTSKVSPDLTFSVKNTTNGLNNSYFDDLMYLLTKKSYVWAVIGYIAMLFVVGTLTWWAPTAIIYAKAMGKNLNDTELLDKSEKDDINFIFGSITIVSGFLGISLGVLLSQMWKNNKFCFKFFPSQSSDALISGLGCLIGAPLLVLGYYLINKNMLISWIILFFAVIALCLNWSIIVDMLMYIIVPNRRNVANSWLILLSHLFGDASGPYIVGLISDRLRGDDKSPKTNFFSLIYAFYGVSILLIVSGFAFLKSAKHLPNDIKSFKVEMKKIKDAQNDEQI